MENSTKTYTVGTWNVKPGKEKEFIQHWTDFAAWVTEHINDKGSGKLFQDTENSSKFYSFGTWENEQQVQQMRTTDEFKSFAAKFEEVLAEYTLPKVMKLASQVGK